MAPLVTRGMMTSQPVSVAGGTITDNLYMRETPKIIKFMRKYDTPMLKLIKPGGEHELTKWEYGSGDYISRKDVTTGTHTNSTTTLNVANGLKYQKFEIIRIPSTGEQMFITAITSNALTVLRNWPAGGNGVALGAPADVQILGSAMPEGADHVASPSAQGELDYTHPQIMEYTWAYTHRGRNTPNYESKTNDQYKRERDLKVKEAANDLDSFLLHGLRDPGLADGTRPSTMMGLRQGTSTYSLNVNGDPLTLDDVMVAAQVLYDDVGKDDMGKTLMGNLLTKQIFNSWFQPNRISTNMRDKEMNLVWDEVETDFGVFKFVLNSKCDANELYLWNPKECSLDRFRGGNWSIGMYATQGWYDVGFLRGDFGGMFQAPRRRTRIYGFSVDKDDYPWINRAA